MLRRSMCLRRVGVQASRGTSPSVDVARRHKHREVKYKRHGYEQIQGAQVPMHDSKKYINETSALLLACMCMRRIQCVRRGIQINGFQCMRRVLDASADTCNMSHDIQWPRGRDCNDGLLLFVCSRVPTRITHGRPSTL